MRKTSVLLQKNYLILFGIISAILIVGAVVLCIATNFSSSGENTVTTEGTVVSVKEQVDTEEHTNAIVSVTKYHLVVNFISPEIGEHTVVISESYSTREFASNKIGEKRTITVDPTNLVEVPKPAFNFLFLIPLIIGLGGAGTVFYFSQKNPHTSKKIRLVEEVNQVDI